MCPVGGAVDAGSAGGEHGLRGGALQEIPAAAGRAAELPEDRASAQH